jgi:S1-C subfamily serine protease
MTDDWEDFDEPPPRRWPYWLTAGVLIPAAIGGALLWPLPAEGDGPKARPTVKVMYLGGHGSGVHIGNGFIVTAAHVVDGQSDIDIKFSDGSVYGDDNKPCSLVPNCNKPEPVTVMWVNTRLDIALIRVGNFENAASAPLSCVDPAIGTPITVEGNPIMFEFVTSYGRVGSTSQTVSWNGQVVWPAVYTIDADASPGNSGGPLYNEDGEVVGILVGRIPGEALRWAVPASVVCGLLGRV